MPPVVVTPPNMCVCGYKICKCNAQQQGLKKYPELQNADTTRPINVNRGVVKIPPAKPFKP